MEEIREIPEGWEIDSIDKLCEIVDYRGKTPEKVDMGTFLVTARNIRNGKIDYNISKEYVITEKYEGIMSRGLPKIGDVLITTEAPLGEVASIDNDGIALAQRIIKLRGKKSKLENKYLKYFLLSKEFQKEIKNDATGSTVDGIKGSRLRKKLIKFPKSTKEQLIISDILEKLDQNIEKTEQTIEKYIKIKNGLMDDLLTGKRRFKNGKWVEETEFKKVEGVGRIPKEWDVVSLKECTSKIADRDHTTPIYVDNGIPIISPKDFNDIEEIEFDECKYITLEAHIKNAKKTNIEVGDIIFTRIGAGLGKACLVTNEMPEFSILHSAAMIKPLKEINNYFLLYYMRSSYFQKQIGKEIQSIGVPDLGLDKINDFIVVKPQDMKEQKIIGNIIHKNIQIIQKELDYLKKLKSLKSGLMEDLLTGKVRVK